MRQWASEWVDRLVASDPGLTRLLTALQVVASVGLAMLAEWVFVRLTGAAQIDTHGVALPPEQAAQVAAQHHGVLVIAIMLGAVMGMIASFGAPMYASTPALLAGYAIIPPLMVGGLTLGVWLHPHRLVSLTLLVVALTAGTYARRWGPIGLIGGQVVFMGTFFGYFLGAQLALSNLGWLAAEIVLGVTVAALLRFTVFNRGHRAALRRMVRSYSARVRQVSSLALECFQAGPAERPRLAARLQRRLVRLNEAALMVDARIGDPRALPAGVTARQLHRLVFDGELSVTNTARFTVALAGRDLPAALREQIRQALLAVEGQPASEIRRIAGALREASVSGYSQDTVVVLHRLATSMEGCAQTREDWRRLEPKLMRRAAPDEAATVADEVPEFVPSAMLIGGWLPGAAMVNAQASTETDLGRWSGFGIAPHVRAAVQMGVAVTGAIVLGDLLSGRRFYWAVIAAFITFMGANNAAEQLRKGLNRVVGTIVGVFVGAAGAHLVGHHTGVAVALILVALFVGIYLMRVSYAFMAIGITVMVSQLYMQLEEFSDALLRLRVEETAIGAGVAVLVVVCVLPLYPRRVTRVATREFLRSLGVLTDAAVHRLRTACDPSTADATRGGLDALRFAARDLDAAYQAIVATSAPLRLPVTGATDALTRQLLHSVNAARDYARNLIVDTARPQRFEPVDAEALLAAGAQLRESIEQISAAGEHRDGDQRTYVRAAGLFEHVGAGATSGSLALRDLQLIDGVMANLAAAAGLTVRALDTEPAGDQRFHAVPGQQAARPPA